MFRPIDPKQDLVELEHGVLALWQERRTFARLRAQLAGGPRWSFLDGPITANNPMGVHHAWGRAYKDLYQRFHAMLGHDQRWQNGFDCQGLWVEVNVERDLGFTSKRDIEAYGIAEFVSLCKQRVLTYAARQTEQSQPARHVDGLERPRRAAPAARPARGGSRPQATIEGVDGPRDRHAPRCSSGGSAQRDARGQLLHVQQREQRPHLGLPRRVPPARLDLQGPRLDAVVSALRDRLVPDGDERGLRGPRGSRADDQAPAARPAGRVTARLDHDAMDARRERRRGGRSGTALRPDPAGRRVVLGRPGRAPDGGRRRVPGRGGEARQRARRLALRGPVRRPPRRPQGVRGRGLRAPGRALERGRRGRGHGHRPHRAGRRRRGLPARQVARAAGDRADRRGRPLRRRVRLAAAARRPRTSRRRSSTTSSGAAASTTSSRTPTAIRTAGGAARRCSSGSSTSGSSRWARSTTSRAPS